MAWRGNTKSQRNAASVIAITTARDDVSAVIGLHVMAAKFCVEASRMSR